LTVFLYSCSDDSNVQEIDLKTDNTPLMKEVMEIATTQAPIQSNINGRVQKRQVQGSVRNFNVKGDQTSFCIVNYKGGGFVLISADKRTTPILAYSDTGNFEGERIDMPRELLG